MCRKSSVNYLLSRPAAFKSPGNCVLRSLLLQSALHNLHPVFANRCSRAIFQNNDRIKLHYNASKIVALFGCLKSPDNDISSIDLKSHL